MAKDFRKIQKLVNILLGKQILTPPFEPGKTVSPATDGYDVIYDANGQPLSPEQLTKIQTDAVLSHILYKHLLHPTATVKVNLLEIDGQPIKEEVIRHCANIINNFVVDPNSADRAAYYRMMEIWRGKYLFAVTSLATQADIQTALVSLEQKSDERLHQKSKVNLLSSHKRWRI